MTHLPYAEWYFTSENSFIFTVLSSNSVTWIKSLKWEIHPVERLRRTTEINANWFDPTSMRWKKPAFLQDF